MGLTKTEAYVYKSQFDGSESLKIRTNIYHLNTDKTNKSSEHLFGGEVAGNDSEVIARIRIIADILNRSNCRCHFKIYNDNLEFIDEYPKLK